MPKLWNQTIQSHRHQVREAIMDTTAELVEEHGLRAVTMSQIATNTGIGRATLYKYFPSVEAILLAWHERRVAEHLERLVEARDRARGIAEGLASVLETYALIVHATHGHRATELGAFLHHDGQVGDARRRLHDLVQGMLAEGAESGDLRNDIPPDELATYCLHALIAAERLHTRAAVQRLVKVILAGLSPGP